LLTDIAFSGRFEGRTHLLPVRVYYEDTDLSGVVYHANHLRFLERGRSDFLRMVGLRHADLLEREEPLAFAVTGMDLRFKLAARIDDSLLVRTTYDAIRGPRLLISQELTRGDDLVMRASVEAVCIDLKGRAKRPPPDLVTRLTPWLKPADA
jgi:acyl-CoA thioester hydrolase